MEDTMANEDIVSCVKALPVNDVAEWIEQLQSIRDQMADALDGLVKCQAPDGTRCAPNADDVEKAIKVLRLRPGIRGIESE